MIGVLLGDAVTEEDLNYKSKIEQLIVTEKLEQSIYMAGFRNDIEHFLALSDFLLVPSEEGLGLAALEAMSAHCRVVSVDKGGAKELLEKAECGIRYSPEATPDDIAAYIIKAIDENDTQATDRGYAFCLMQTYDEYRKSLLDVLSKED